jgi:acyl-CoA synthetase (NDP forming)
VLRCGRPEELFDAAHLLAAQPLPAGRRIAIVTNSGGLGTLGADAAGAAGLAVPRLDDAVQAAVLAAAPSCDQSANPVDMGIGAGPAEYAGVMRALLEADAVDAVLAFYVQLSPTAPDAVLHAIDDAAAGAGKPVAASILGADGRPLRDADVRVPNLRFPESCVAALAQAAQRRDWLSRPLGQRAHLADDDAAQARELVSAALGERETCWLSDADARRLLAQRGIAATPTVRCDSPDDAVREAAALGRPVALKAWFDPPESASDIDAVLLGLEGEGAVRAAWEELGRRVAVAGRPWHGAAVQPLVPAGADVLVGSLSDADLGPVVAVGPGGRQAGLARDVSFRLAALTDVDADELIADATAVAAQLEGFRGAPQLDHAALRELILRFAALLQAVPELVEVDLNPVRVQPEGAEVIDVRMRAERRTQRTRLKTW